MRWTADRQQLLADLSAHGLSAREIARLSGESVGAVKKVMWRYGLYARAKRSLCRSRMRTPRDEPVPQMRG
jgi:hypothetical protein